MYVKNSITFKILEDLLHVSLEIIWILTRPTRLPRGISQVIIGTLYHPPGADDQLILDYLYKSLSSIEFCNFCNFCQTRKQNGFLEEKFPRKAFRTF